MKNEKSIHILLVEDSETDVKIILRAFQKNKLSCTVNIVGDGEHALKYLLHEGSFVERDRFPLPDIILLDVNMPRMDGHTFVKRARALKGVAEIPIVVFTKKEGFKDAFRFEGVSDYVVKSIDGVDMVKKIKEILKFKEEFFGD